MKLNIKRFAPDPWDLTTFFSDYKYNANGELTQVTLTIIGNYNISVIYDIDNEGNELSDDSSWENHSASDSYPHADMPYIRRTFYNLNNLKGVKLISYESRKGQIQTITYNFKMATEEPATTTYLTKTSATAVLKGNVLNSLNTYDYNNAPSVAAVRNYLDSGGIIRQSDIEPIVSQAVSNALLTAHPIGSIEINVSGINPETYLGGTWEAFGSGRVLIGVGTGTDTNNTSQTFSSAEVTGGEYTHKLTIAEMPSHNHQIKTNNDDWNNSPNGGKYGTTHDGANSWYNTDWYTIHSGGNGAHNNIQPYITAYFWKRIN
ncbi:MAG: hypothetical protein PUJ51_19190 [Clostridiales bacterium]|nr:hypothetical protein [Clostridiales bacterium]